MDTRRLETGDRSVYKSYVFSDPNQSEFDRLLSGSVTINNVSKKESRKTISQLIILSVAFMFVFAAFSAIQDLQSSLYTDEGLGTLSLGIIYAGTVISCLCSPALLHRFSLKKILVGGFVCHMIFVAVHYYPSSCSLIPASVLLGLATGPIWTSQGAFITRLAMKYSEKPNSIPAISISRFNGIFFMVFQSGAIWGNLISSFVLEEDVGNSTHIIVINGSKILNRNKSHHTHPKLKCGPQNCPWTNLHKTKLVEPDQNITYLLISIYVGAVVFGILVSLFLLKNITSSHNATEARHLDRLASTVRLLKDYRTFLLIPLFLFSGTEQTLIVGEFTKSFTSCMLGIGWVGYTMICFCGCSALASLFSSSLVKSVGRPAVICIAGMVNISLMIWMLEWKATSDAMASFFILPGLWGVADGIWQSQINALLGIQYADDDEPAFANYRLFQAMGTSIAFIGSKYLCYSAKVYVNLGLVSLGLILYIVLEFRLKFENEAKKIRTPSMPSLQ